MNKSRGGGKWVNGLKIGTKTRVILGDKQEVVD